MGPRDTVYSNLSRDILNHELPSLSPVSIPTSRYENQCELFEIIFVVFQDIRNLPCESDGKNPGKDIGSKGIGAFWPWLGPNIGQNGVIKWRFFESFAKILHCVCTRIASRQILFCPIPIPTSERPFMDTRTKNTIKNWVCTYIRMSSAHWAPWNLHCITQYYAHQGIF